jgi:hypothetical protein
LPALDDLRAGAAQVVGLSGISYGYTLTTWSAGALCIGRFGLPSPAEAFGFVGGASVAYLGLSLALRRSKAAPPLHGAPRVLWENHVALPALAATYGVSRLIASPGPSFFVVPLVATFLYLVGLTFLVSRHHLRRRTTAHDIDRHEYADIDGSEAIPDRHEARDGP